MSAGCTVGPVVHQQEHQTVDVQNGVVIIIIIISSSSSILTFLPYSYEFLVFSLTC